MSIPCVPIPCLFRVQFNDHGSQSCIWVQLSHVYSVCSYSMSIPCAAIPCLFREQLSHVYSASSYPMSIPCAVIPCLFRAQLFHVYSVCRLMTMALKAALALLVLCCLVREAEPSYPSECNDPCRRLEKFHQTFKCGTCKSNFRCFEVEHEMKENDCSSDGTCQSSMGVCVCVCVCVFCVSMCVRFV